MQSALVSLLPLSPLFSPSPLSPSGPQGKEEGEGLTRSRQGSQESCWLSRLWEWLGRRIWWFHVTELDHKSLGFIFMCNLVCAGKIQKTSTKSTRVYKSYQYACQESQLWYNRIECESLLVKETCWILETSAVYYSDMLLELSRACCIQHRICLLNQCHQSKFKLHLREREVRSK